MDFLTYLFILSFSFSYIEAAVVPNNSEDSEPVTAENSSVIPLFTFGEKSYYISKFKLSFFEAYQFCEEIHMQLATIQSSEELDALTKFVQQNKGDNYWISGSRLVDNRNWIWMSTLQVVEYTSWSTGQPDFPSEQCLQLWFAGKKQLSYNNRDCFSKINFICEKDKNLLRVTREVKDSNYLSSLDSEYVSPNINVLHFKEKSYYIGNTFKATFLQASQFCQILRMKLVSVNSDAESKMLHKYIRDTIAGDNFWSSGSKLIDGKNLIWLSTGQRTDYTNWLPNQPDNPNEMCIELVQKRNEGLFWNDLNCDTKLFFICEQYNNNLLEEREPPLKQKRASTVPVTNADPIIQYADNPTLPISIIDGVKFRVSKFKTTQEKASQSCKQYGMELVSILDKTKNDIVIKLVQQHGNNYYWTSARRQPDNKWIWWELQPMVYTNWAPNEPNDAVKPELCIQLYPTGQWNDLKCDREQLFICENRFTESLNPSSDHCGSQQIPTVNVYVNNNQCTKTKNGTVTQTKNMTTSRDEEEYNIEINNTTESLCDSQKTVPST